MNSFLRFLKFLSLGIWVGALVYLSFVVAPAIFSRLSNLDQAGMLVGVMISRLHWLGVICGAVFVLAGLALARSLKGLPRLGSLAVLVMIALTLFAQLGIIPRMDRLRTQMGSYQDTPATNPLRQQFNQLHVDSVHLEEGVLLLGLVAIFLTAKDPLK